MGIIIRQSFKTTIVLYIGVVIGLFNRLFFLPNFLTLEQLGLLDVLVMVSTLLARISYLGLQGSITKFFSYYKDKNLLRTFSGIFLLIPILGYIILGGLFYVFQDEVVILFSKNKALFSEYYYFIFPLALIVIFREVFSVFSVNNMRMTVPSLLNEIILRLGIMVILLLIGYGYLTFYNYVVLQTVIYAIVVVILVLYCRINLNFGIDFNFRLIKMEEYKKIFTYSLFIFFAGISGTISQYTDSLMVASIKGFESSAIYTIAFFIGISIEMPRRAITSIGASVIAKYWNENNKEEIHKLYKQSSINQGILGVLLFLLVVVNIDEIFFLLPKRDVLVAGKSVAIIIGASRVIEMLGGVNTEILRTSDKYKIDLIVLISFIGVSVITNLMLIPVLGLNGAAFATLISVFLYNFVRYLILKKLYSFEPFTIKILYLLLILSVCLMINYFLPEVVIDSMVWSIALIILKSVLYGGVFIVVVYRLKLSDEVNGLLRNLLKLRSYD